MMGRYQLPGKSAWTGTWRLPTDNKDQRRSKRAQKRGREKRSTQQDVRDQREETTE